MIEVLSSDAKSGFPSFVDDVKKYVMYVYVRSPHKWQNDDMYWKE